MLAIANSCSTVCHSLDINTAILHAPFPDNCRCFMQAPTGYVPPANKAGNCVRLRKALYGLKQAPREKTPPLSSSSPSSAASDIFRQPLVFLQHAGDNFIAISMNIGDQTIISRSLPPVISLKHALANRFGIAELGETTYTLGLEVQRDFASERLFLSQRTFNATIVERFSSPGRVRWEAHATSLATGNKRRTSDFFTRARHRFKLNTSAMQHLHVTSTTATAVMCS